ncbi:MAG TPA: DUF1992 domain-containing protein, partial [Chloroflexota bacterium]|nr:DUF1992 domain-containing protein [Chloroflexota bacterium]
MPIRRQDGKQKRIDSWEGHVEQMIREAQERGEFDDLPGAGKPLDLTDNPYAGEWQSAFRTARNAGAAPLWVELDREIAAEREQLREMGQRSARHLQAERARLELDGVREGREGPPGQRWWRRLLYGARGTAAAGRSARPRSLEELEAELERARRIYLKRAGAIDEKIRDFNTHRPRNLSWL